MRSGQYSLLEANAKVNGRGEISPPPLPKPLAYLDTVSFKCVTVSIQRVGVLNLV